MVAESQPARFSVVQQGADLVLCLSGTIELGCLAGLWNRVLAESRKSPDLRLVIDLSAAGVCDTAGATLLLQAERVHGGVALFRGASARTEAVIALVRPASVPVSAPVAPPEPGWRDVLWPGLAVCSQGVAYLGELAVALARLPARRRMFRLRDALAAADAAGVRAVPLVLLLGGLIGLILAFQSLVPMRRFGADVYVANLVALSLVRELGPLLTAVVLAGRSGSAFAAEIGTMKVNQELDALATMGVDAMTMLVLPRLLAAMLVMPVLTVLMDLAGLAGMTVVLNASGLPIVAIMNEVAYAVVPRDFLGGLFKAGLFGMAVAVIGCRAGLGTGVGPRAVGLSATAAVVGGIVATVVLDGVLAVLFFRLGW